jgi:hypothetical protein
MAACALTQGYVQDCSNFFGGVKNVFIIEYPNLSAITIVAGVVTALTKVTGKFFRKYEIEAHTGEADDNLTVKPEMGTRSTKQSVKFPINGMSASVRAEIELLAQNRLIFVIEDNNGIFYMYGKDFGLRLQSVKAGTGKALGDRSGYDFVFEGEEKFLAFSVEAGVAAVLETPGV